MKIRLRFPLSTAFAVALTLGTAFFGCAEEEASEDENVLNSSSNDAIEGTTADGALPDMPTEDAVEDDEDVAESTEGGTLVDDCPADDPFSDDFLVVYGLQGRVQGLNLNERELFVMTGSGKNPVNPDSPDPLSVTDFSLKGEKHQWCQDSEEWELSCQYGCVIDDGMNWIGVYIPVPADQELNPDSDDYNPDLACLVESEEDPPVASKGGSVWLGQLGSTLKANMLKGAILRNVAHFVFRGGKMYYSRQETCFGESCTYKVYMRDLEINVNEETVLTEFPPPEQIDGSTYGGYFEVSEDGEMLAFLNPTIRSQSYWTWTKGTIQFHKTLCAAEENGECVGTGSEYRDRDPVAISPDDDHEYLITMTISENNLRAWRYRTNAEGEPKWSNLVSTPAGTNYSQSVCEHLSEPWHYQRIEGLQFTPEGDSVVYLGKSDECNGVGIKSESDLLEMPISLIGNGKPIEADDIRNITQNPKTNTASNIVYSYFDICSNGEVLVASGTPSVDKDGKPLSDDDQITKSDREMYLISRDGCFKKQMTKSPTYAVSSVQCVPNPFSQ